MSDGHDLIVIGSYVQDHVWLTKTFPDAGETRRADGFSTGPGGKGFNQAIAARRQGARVLFAGAIGRDHLGRGAQEFARHEGLHCRWQLVDDAPTAAAGIVVDGGGRNQIVVALGANERLAPLRLDGLAEAVAGARLLLLQLEIHLDAIDAVLDLAAAHNVPIVLNPAPVHPELRPEQLERIELLTPNETEFALLVRRFAGGGLTGEQVATLSDDALHAYARRLGVATIVVTLGEHGCFVSHGQDSRHGQGETDRYRVPAERVQAIDSTGAGDAFNGALAAALVRDSEHGFRAAVEHANRCAALSTETLGAATSMPGLDQVQQRFRPT